jgi:hypothetical protein
MNSNEELLHGLLKIDYIYLSWKPRQIKTWSIDEKENCPWERKSIDDFLTNEANFIYENILCWMQLAISMFMTLNDGMLINMLPYFWKLNNFVMRLFPFCVMTNGFFTMGVGWCLFVFWQVRKRG